MKRFISNRFILFALGIITLLMVWFLISLLVDRNGSIFPSPFLTFNRLLVLLGDPYTYTCLWHTLMRMIIGFLASFAAALVFGILAGNHPSLYQFFKPLMVTLKSVPTVALVFLFIVLFTPKDAPIFVVMLICFPIIYEAIAGGINNVDKQTVDAAKIDGASYLKRVVYIKLPLALPFMIVGMVSSFALSFKIEIMAEVLTGYTRNGLGSAIQYARTSNPSDMATIFAYALIAIIVMLIVSLIEEIVKRQMVKRYLITEQK